MRRRISHLIVILGLTAGLAHAQHAALTTPGENDMYCSGVVTTEKVPTDTYIISGEESDQRILWKEGRLVFINKGAKQGVKVGDQFFVVRPESDPQMATQWVKWQASINKAMGTDWADLARLRVANVEENTSTAEVIKACDYVERGDIVLPFSERPAPQYKPQAKFDIFAPPSGKPKAMVASKLGFGVQAGAGDVVYVNLGGKQGVKVGDYFRIFRYQDNHHSNVYEIPKADYMTFGFGSAPRAYNWSELPRDILGEGIVIRLGTNAATVLLTKSLRDIYVGDYVELE